MQYFLLCFVCVFWKQFLFLFIEKYCKRINSLWPSNSVTYFYSFPNCFGSQNATCEVPKFLTALYNCISDVSAVSTKTVRNASVTKMFKTILVTVWSYLNSYYLDSHKKSFFNFNFRITILLISCFLFKVVFIAATGLTDIFSGNLV